MITRYDNTLSVLIVDNDKAEFLRTSAQINTIVSQSFSTEWCANYKQAADRFRESRHDVYFINYRIGEQTALDLLRERDPQNIDKPVILLTGQIREAIDPEAMRLGVVDHLAKSELNHETLERCIRHCLERSATLKAARSSERKYRNIVERTRDTIFVADAHLVIRNINGAASELFGKDHASLLGTSFYDSMTDDAEKTLLAQTLAAWGALDRFQIRLKTPNGQEEKIALVSATTEIDHFGKTYIQGIVYDKSLYKKTEEIKVQAERLEAKAQVIRTLAHEIRNPLNNISVSVDQLKAYLPEESAELLSIVRRGVIRIDTLISELMDSAQYVKMSFTIVPLQIVIYKALEEATDRLTLRKIQVRFSPVSAPALALVDLEKLKVALLNIILNAIEAMETGSGVLEIILQSTHDVHTLSIRDNGSGMTSEVVDRVFEPYFTSKPNGVGIGLSTTRGIMESHKGNIEVKSAPEHGTTFIVTLPAL